MLACVITDGRKESPTAGKGGGAFEARVAQSGPHWASGTRESGRGSTTAAFADKFGSPLLPMCEVTLTTQAATTPTVTPSSLVADWREMAEQTPNRQNLRYVNNQSDRFVATFQTALPYITSSSRVLSVGAGAAYVEASLAKATGCQVTVIDFPQAIEAHRGHYDSLGFNTIGANLAEDDLSVRPERFDVVLHSEVIEHVPVAPSIQLRAFRPLIAPGGRLFVTTPNAGGLRNIVKVILSKPLLLTPEETFSPVSYETEHIHRREYMPIEIEHAMRVNDIEPEGRRYCWYGRERRIVKASGFVPRFRDCMVIYGVAGAGS